MERAPIAEHAISALERETVRRVARRLIPLLMLAYFCSYLDRSNFSMAALTMNHQFGFSPATFGFGAGLFSWNTFPIDHGRLLGLLQQAAGGAYGRIVSANAATLYGWD